MRGLKRKFGLSLEPDRRGGSRWLLALALSVLGLLVLLSFFVYVSRLSRAPGGTDYGTGGQAFTRAVAEIAAPANIEITADKGATISWDGSDDERIIGYNVYRYKAQDDDGGKVNAAIVSDTVYYDDEGTMFNSYAVAPVDNEGREGVLSARVAASVDPASLATVTPTRKPEKVEDITFDQAAAKDAVPGLVFCDAAGMVYEGVWYKEHYAEVTGGAMMVTPYSGDSASYTFSGDSVAVISTRHWNYGIMEVYIDGELRQQVDLYSPSVNTSATVFSASGLGPGTHTIRLVCTGRKNPDANFTFINLEALRID